MNNKLNQEEKEFLNLFSNQNVQANPVFKARLKQKTLSQLEPHFSIFSLFNSSAFNFAAVIAFSFITVISGFFVISELTRPTNINNTQVFSEQVKQQVVEKVAEQTSVSAIKLLTVNDFLSGDTLEKPTKPVGDDYNLKTTQVTYVPSKVAVCTDLNLPKELTITQLYEYFGDNKTVSKLTKNNQTIAVNEFQDTNTIPTSFPVSYISYPVSFSVDAQPAVSADVLNLNSNFEVLERTQDSQTAFTITDSILFDCNNKSPLSFPTSFPVSFAGEKPMDTIIREFILNPDYTINKVNLYLNKIESSSKLAEITIRTQKDTISEQSADIILNNNL